jgi:hypothetical protein
MADSIGGQTVRAKIKGLAGGPLLYAVAEPDPTKAVTIVREGIGAAPDDLVETIGPIPAENIATLGLSPGEFERL